VRTVSLSGCRQLTGPKQAIKMDDYVIKEVVSTRCLGVQIHVHVDNALKRDHHVLELMKSFTQKLYLLNHCTSCLDRRELIPILGSVTYGMLVWGSCGQVLFSDLESIYA